MINEEDFINDDSFNASDSSNEPRSLEEQEQNNSNALIVDINNADRFDESTVNSIDDAKGTSDFLEKAIPEDNLDGDSDQDYTLSKNLRGDNPPGSEQAAFDAGLHGDMSAEQARYQSENIVENFRENLDKTASEIELDKKLKGNDQ